MSSEFTIDFGRHFDRDLKKLARDVVKKTVADWQKMFDSVHKRYSGKSVSVIKPALKREWKSLGVSISERDLTEYATLISEGTRITVKAK